MEASKTRKQFRASKLGDNSNHDVSSVANLSSHTENRSTSYRRRRRRHSYQDGSAPVSPAALDFLQVGSRPTAGEDATTVSTGRSTLHRSPPQATVTESSQPSSPMRVENDSSSTSTTCTAGASACNLPYSRVVCSDTQKCLTAMVWKRRTGIGGKLSSKPKTWERRRIELKGSVLSYHKSATVSQRLQQQLQEEDETQSQQQQQQQQRSSPAIPSAGWVYGNAKYAIDFVSMQPTFATRASLKRKHGVPNDHRRLSE